MMQCLDNLKVELYLSRKHPDKSLDPNIEENEEGNKDSDGQPAKPTNKIQVIKKEVDDHKEMTDSDSSLTDQHETSAGSIVKSETNHDYSEESDAGHNDWIKMSIQGSSSFYEEFVPEEDEGRVTTEEVKHKKRTIKYVNRWF